MNRRALLRYAAALPLAAYAETPAFAAAKPFRRLRPGDAGWPSEADWNGLRQAVGGALEKPVSPYGACLTPGGGEACKATAPLLQNPFYLGDQSGGTQVSGWLGAWTPKLSAYAVTARSAADVAAAVNFAREHRLRLCVKGGGHSYQGTSNAPDSLMVFTRHMNAVTLHDAFVPQGCEGMAPAHAVSAGAGCMWIDVYDAVTVKGGRYAQGGGCTSVGVAGHIQSGGFGSFSKGFGTAAGNLLEAEVVTADGKIRIVNAKQDPELFWAIKGGGGGSFGVVTRVTVRTHDLPERLGGAEAVIKANSDQAYRALIERFMGFFAEVLMNPHWGEQAAIRPDNRLKITMACQGLTGEQAVATWKPFVDWVAARPGDYAFEEAFDAGAGPSRGYWDAEARKRRGNGAMVSDSRPGAPATHAWWRGDQEQVSMFLHGYESVWLPASMLRPENRARLAEALFAASRHFDVGLHFNKGLAGASDEMLKHAADTAMNPAALSAFALAIIATGGQPPWPGLPAGMKEEPGVAERHAKAIDAATAELWKIAPERGSYVSESNYFNKAWQSAFFGPNYPRLRRVKARYDPEGLFFVHHGVGSEDWDAGGFVRRG
ncbi:MAG: FAD-binding oxidoreductase [Proteobacteria bacterium]|nr:FAD-binding oxidoreductase [Pseudomonadota bacterium]